MNILFMNIKKGQTDKLDKKTTVQKINNKDARAVTN